MRQVERMIRQVVTSRPDLLKAFAEKNQPSKELAESRARVKTILRQVGAGKPLATLPLLQH